MEENASPYPTDRTVYFFGNHIYNTLSYLPTVQRYKSLLCEVETRPGAVDGGHD